MATVYTYDASDRLFKVAYADVAPTSSESYAYDAAGNMVGKLDRRGNAITYGYDAANRQTSVSCSPGSGVVGTTDLVCEYDGLNRRTLERDSVDAALDANDWIVTRTWDALSRVTSETQNGRRSRTRGRRRRSERPSTTPRPRTR
jgi:YD repeat-containing protein